MSAFSVASLSEADLHLVQELFRDAGEFVRVRTPSDYWLYARLFCDSCIVAKQNERLVGAVIAFRDQTRRFEEIYVQDIAVARGHQRQGIGRELIRELTNRARDWAVARIWLTTEPTNIAAIHLWHYCGFANFPADYMCSGTWITRDLKGLGRDRAVFELRL